MNLESIMGKKYEQIYTSSSYYAPLNVSCYPVNELNDIFVIKKVQKYFSFPFFSKKKKNMKTLFITL